MSILFEDLRAELEGLTSASGEARHLRWLAHELAVGRTAAGDYEIFLRGDPLVATSSVVARHLQHGQWAPKAGGENFAASRIILPSVPQFASVAALIAVELLRAGIDGSGHPQQPFSDVEPIIEMAIRRGALAENVIIGLIGELILVRQCLLSALSTPARYAEIINAWQGWQHGGRDFRLGRYAVEVKTTQSQSSLHEFTGIHQLEPENEESGVTEDLYVLSIGMIASTTTGETLPEVVDSILNLLSGSLGGSAGPVQDMFLRSVSLYGTQAATGYSHFAMREWSAYTVRYSHSFAPRLYRVADPAMALLERSTIAETCVVPSSVSFSALFPERVSAFNPAENWLTAISEIVKATAER